MKPNLLTMTIAAGVFGLSAAASAEIVTATFTGTVNFVYDPVPPASEGDTLVATYVFDLANATGSNLSPTGGEISGPYGSFVTASVSVNGVVAGALPTFNYSGELEGETQVFETGSIVGATLLGSGTMFVSTVEGTDFSWPLTLPPTGFSYNPTDSDQTQIFLSDSAGDLLEGDVSNVTIAVSTTPQPPAVPEPSTWAMMLLGFAGVGLFSYCSRARPRHMSA